MKKLPIGIQNFRTIREKDYLYIDKTEIIHQLIDFGKYYFLSRPRRFGKSLTLSTIKELFLGSKELFKGLWIENHWNWEVKHPVLHIQFEALGYMDKGTSPAISDFLIKEAKKHQITLKEKFPGVQLKELLKKLVEKYQQPVVILIDEYDKPILDYLEDFPAAEAQKNELKKFYSVIKSSDEFIQLLLITGVSKFSKVSIFSELNNLDDITIDYRFSTLTGYTQAELELFFEDRITANLKQNNISRTALLANIKLWYNGYSWDAKNSVYNPFSVLNYFQKNAFRNYWFSTGTPTFLIKLLKERHIYNISGIQAGQTTLDSFDLSYIEASSILFQTGYLTIKSVDDVGIYTLDYPNQEVKDSLLQYLIGAFSHSPKGDSTPIVVSLRNAFLAEDIPTIIKIINGLFKSIPSHIFIKEKEAYYHSVVFLVFQYLGQFVDAEVHTSDGRMDAVVTTATHIFILEFKLDQSSTEAIQQIQNKGYAEKYQPSKKSILGIGINFSSKTKSVENWETINL